MNIGSDMVKEKVELLFVTKKDFVTKKSANSLTNIYNLIFL